MYQTMTFTVSELVYMMRNMEIGAEIGLAQTANGEYSYGIRRLPDDMFDNGKCWLADYYGGGSTVAFSEQEELDEGDPDCLGIRLYNWLRQEDLLTNGGEYVFVQRKDGSLPDTRWEFKAVRIPAKNRLVCVNFGLERPHHTYVSVPPNATENEIMRITKEALIKLTPETFDAHVLSTAVDLDPYVSDDDIVWMEVDPLYSRITDLPTGTIGR